MYINNPQYLPCTIQEVQTRVDDLLKTFHQSDAFVKVIIEALKSDNFAEIITLEEMTSLVYLFQTSLLTMGFDLHSLKANVDFLCLPEKRSKKKRQKLLEKEPDAILGFLYKILFLRFLRFLLLFRRRETALSAEKDITPSLFRFCGISWPLSNIC